MPLKMTNEVSVMDVVAIGGLLLGGATVFFGMGADVQTHSVQIAENTRAISRVEHKAEEDNNKVIEMLKAQSIEVRIIRQEAESGRMRIEDKLDRLVERELNGAHK
jgi:hypothetical protein